MNADQDPNVASEAQAPFVTADLRERATSISTYKQHRESGRTARQRTPRSSHATWAPASDRPDPVDLLEAQARNRDPDLLPIRYARMIPSPSTFLQGAAVVMATAGLYQTSGDWLYNVGLPGKSGIGGGIVTVSPGKGGLGTYAPPLDKAGNSVKGQLVARFLSLRLGIDLFASLHEG